MAHPMTLPLTAALAIAGTMLGVHLGRSAVAEIDPAYFGPAEGARFFADLVPGGYRAADSASTGSDDFWARDSSLPARSGCAECGDFVEPAAFFPDADYPSVDIGAYAQPPALPPAAAEAAQNLVPEEIERYATFPITVEEAERQRSAAEQSEQLTYADRPPTYRPQGRGGEPAPIGM